MARWSTDKTRLAAVTTAGSPSTTCTVGRAAPTARKLPAPPPGDVATVIAAAPRPILPTLYNMQS